MTPISLRLVHSRRDGGNTDDLVMPLLVSVAGLITQFVFLAAYPFNLIAGI